MMILPILLQSVTPNGGATVFGEGNSSCAKAFSPQRENLTFNWVMGFWSGLNAAANVSVGKDTDAEGIVGEVGLICEREPSKPLVVAAFEAYQKKRSPQPLAHDR